MDTSAALRRARTRAGLTQAGLAALAGTSQATVCAYESGRKQPSVDTFERLLTAAGARLVVEAGHGRLITPSQERHRETGRVLLEVLALAELLPTRHRSDLDFPRLTASAQSA